MPKGELTIRNFGTIGNLEKGSEHLGNCNILENGGQCIRLNSSGGSEQKATAQPNGMCLCGFPLSAVPEGLGYSGRYAPRKSFCPAACEVRRPSYARSGSLPIFWDLFTILNGGEFLPN